MAILLRSNATKPTNKTKFVFMYTGIEYHIIEAFSAFYKNDFYGALYQISPAIEATAKKRYPNNKPSDRIKFFLKDEQDLIFSFSTQCKILVGKNAVVKFGMDEFQSILYKSVRCMQSHEAKLDSSIELGEEFGIGPIRFTSSSSLNGPILISKATIIAVIFSVICAIENRNLKISDVPVRFYDDPAMKLAPFIGNKLNFTRRYYDLFRVPFGQFDL